MQNRIFLFTKITSRYSMLILVFTASFTSLLAAKDTSGQKLDTKKTYVTLQVDNEPLKGVFSEIEKQSKCKFFYDAGQLDVMTPVTLHVKRESLYNILLQLSDRMNLDFKQIGNYFSVRTLKQRTIEETNLAPSGSSSLVSSEYKPITVKQVTDLFTNIIVHGIVSDENGNPLIGVTVEVKGSGQGTTTDKKGNFTINTTDLNAILVFSYVGYESKEIEIKGRSNIDVLLTPIIGGMSEVVVVGYGKQKRSRLTSAVSTLEGNAITGNPVANINNSVAGRISGVLTFQSSGEPGSDAANIRVRGIGTIGSNSQALTIVDGVPRNISQLSPNEIESITVLKDAAAIAPYGLAGANGVILVTTKRGKEGKIALAYNGWYGIQRPTRYPHYLNAYGYATAYNVARKNAGLSPRYSDDELQKYKDRSDLDHFPDNDWVKEVIDFNAPMTSHNLTFSGGSEKIRFFSSLGYLYQQGSVNVINYSRFNLASNVDINATKTTLISLDIKASLEVSKNPGSTTGTGIYTQVTKNPPLLSTPLSFTNGLPGFTLLPSIYNSGYNKDYDNTYFSQLSIEQKIPFLRGLSLKGVVAYDKSYLINKQWQTPYVYYKLNSSDEFDEVKAGVTSPRLNEGFNQRINTTLQGYLTYENSFGNHGINILAVAEERMGDRTGFTASRINYQVNLDELDLGSASKKDLDNGGSSSSSKQIGFVYRASYNYSQKYMVEFSGRYDGHYYFAPGRRFAFFPAVSVGWRLSDEPFIKNNVAWLSNLKLRGSYGKSGNLAGGPFQYLSSYGLRAGYIFGGNQVQGAFERSEPNPYITWETAKKFDIGLDGSILGGRLGFEFDVFKERRSDMLVPPTTTVPIEYGIGLAQVNGGVMENKGFDLSLTSYNSFHNGLKLDVGVTVSYAKNKLINIIEGDDTYNNSNRRRTGRPLDTQFGLKALGLFNSQEEIDGWAKQFGKLQPGDIKYEDINHDGLINNEDEVVIGDPAFPQLIFGFTGNLTWKGFNINMLWQGAAKSSFLLTNEAANPFFNGAKIFEEQLDYWTPENKDAKYPVIMPAPTPNNSQVSSWWIRNGHYLRLKNLEVGYSVPARLIQKINLKSIRIFVAGQNILTFSTEKYLDPEIGISGGSKRARYYFQQKVYTVGLNVNF